ncbi:helix-turn-helix transcriptional regulator [Mycobacterium hubeiense]|uniref:helix-turn-helix transcriptional regulator n=1 Tax=Mycobacterium hubeiense TaxID=1867256 RepID=UPI000C7F2858|nr:LuxR family transcriptional regulator [Mycobacterium sp. QGD 101]
MRSTWPLTGRREELGVIRAAISEPELSGIVIHGAAGVGKSRLAREALQLAASQGFETRWAVGTSAARTLPMGAFAQWAGSAVADRSQYVRSTIDSMLSAPPGAEVVLGVDDAHLLDDLSTMVLQQIVRRRAAKMVLTVRDGDPIPPATQNIWADSEFERLDLQALSRDECTTLLSAALGGPVDQRAAQRLWALTRGNVLYLRNIVDQIVADGRLALRRGRWAWTGDPVVPPNLVAMIEARTASLTTAVRDVVDALAVGEPIELESLRRITEPAAIEEADQRGLITIGRADGRAEVRLAHPLYGEVRRKRAPATTLRRLRGRLAAELANSDPSDMRTVVRRAALSLESDVRADPELLLTAAQAALCLADLPLAERLAAAASRAGAGHQANFVRAFALSRLSRGEEACAVLEAVPAGSLTDKERATHAFMRATIRLFTLQDATGAKKFIDDVAQTIAPEGQDIVEAFLTVYWAALGEPNQALSYAKNLALQKLPEFVDHVAARAVAIACGNAGRTEDAVAAAEAGYAILQDTFDAPHFRLVIADAHISALLESGRVKEACDVAEQHQQRAAELPIAVQPYAEALAGRAALGAGRLDTACELLSPAVDALSDMGDAVGWTYRYQLPLAIALALRSEVDEAADALATAETQRHDSWRCLDYEYALARAWVCAAEGFVSEAIEIAASAAEIARGRGQCAAEVVCLQTATQFGDHTWVPRLRELSAVVEGPRAGAAARFAAALEGDDAAELRAVSEEFERMGDLIAAAAAASHAATVFRRRGMRGSANACVTRADALAKQAGGACIPVLRDPPPLTSREQEIVRLIGEGLTNRAAAERLNVSVRTVEGHIYRAMAKTNTASRAELAALLPRRRRRR